LSFRAGRILPFAAGAVVVSQIDDVEGSDRRVAGMSEHGGGAECAIGNGTRGRRCLERAALHQRYRPNRTPIMIAWLWNSQSNEPPNVSWKQGSAVPKNLQD